MHEDNEASAKEKYRESRPLADRDDDSSGDNCEITQMTLALSSLEVLDKVKNTFRAHDQLGEEELIASGVSASLEKGVKVLVIQTQSHNLEAYIQVRVLTGDHAGELWYIRSDAAGPPEPKSLGKN